MKYYAAVFFGLILMLSTTTLYGQVAPEQWVGYETGRLDLNKKGMMVLSGWALANLASGAIGWAAAKGSTRYFFQMNTLWNVVNIGLGVAGYLNAVNTDPAGLSQSEIVKGYSGMQNLFIFNAGLDVAYMAVGVFLLERAKNVSKNKDLFRGYGSSLIMQGGFLFAFDLIMYLVHRNYANINLYPLLGSDVHGLGMLIRF